jgi:hypothetical protein
MQDTAEAKSDRKQLNSVTVDVLRVREVFSVQCVKTTEGLWVKSVGLAVSKHHLYNGRRARTKSSCTVG